MRFADSDVRPNAPRPLKDVFVGPSYDLRHKDVPDPDQDGQTTGARIAPQGEEER